MANEEHLGNLNKGVGIWNKWRQRNPDIQPNLIEADLRGASLSWANFIGANLSGANLEEADLERAILSGADLCEANLRRADLNEANLINADLSRAIVDNANLKDISLLETKFLDINLGTVKGLVSCNHHGPSVVDHRTLMKSGPLPEVFLRGCGLPDQLIEYLPSLRNEPFRFYSCFISYSHMDEEFAKRLYDALQGEGVRCWFAPEDLKIGDKTRHRIDDSIRVHDKLLLILSENSIESGWVEYEGERALEQERKRGGTVLFPIRLDNAIMNIEGTWADHIRERHIGDFRKWKDHDSYQRGFERLIRDLKSEGGKVEGSGHGQ